MHAALLFPLFQVFSCAGHAGPQVKSMEHTQVVVGLVALAQRFLVLKWISTRQSTPTLQKGESLTSNCQACGHRSQLTIQVKASQAMQGASSILIVRRRPLVSRLVYISFISLSFYRIPYHKENLYIIQRLCSVRFFLRGMFSSLTIVQQSRFFIFIFS